MGHAFHKYATEKQEVFSAMLWSSQPENELLRQYFPLFCRPSIPGTSYLKSTSMAYNSFQMSESIATDNFSKSTVPYFESTESVISAFPTAAMEFSIFVSQSNFVSLISLHFTA